MNTATKPWNWTERDFIATPVVICGSADEPFRIAPADRAILDAMPAGERPVALQYLYSAWQHEMARRLSGTIIPTPWAKAHLAREWGKHWQAFNAAAMAEYTADARCAA